MRIINPSFGHAPLATEKVKSGPVDWLRARRRGLMLIDAPGMAKQIEGYTLGVPNESFRRSLLARLTPLMSRAPRILVQRKDISK